MRFLPYYKEDMERLGQALSCRHNNRYNGLVMDTKYRSSTPDFFSRRPLLDGYNNEKLWVFMNNLWKDPANYKVLMARRMLNLSHALMQEWEVSGDEQYLTDGIMSNTAFLLSAIAIADRYAYRKRFPRILICDDIMLHGRGIINLLSKFLRIVKNRLAESGEEVSERRLEVDLYNSVSIYVFARNEDEGLLIDEEKYRIFAAQILPMKQLRELSLQISNYLQSCGVANTSYVISAKLPWYQLRILYKEWGDRLSETFQYKGRRQHVFFKERSPRILETIRICYPDGDPEKGGVLTSLPVFGDIPREAFSDLCRTVANYMDQSTRYSQVAEYLRQDNEELIKPKAQLLSFIYSILSLADFCRQRLNADSKDVYRILIDGDFDKIVTNFDTGEQFRYEIMRLFRDISMSKSASAVLWDYLDWAAQELILDRKKNSDAQYTGEFRLISGPDRKRRKKRYEDAEDIFYEVGTDAEYDAYRYIRTETEYDAKRPGFDLISFRQYMHFMYRKRSSSEHSIGCMFGLMDGGLISMNLEAEREREGQVVRTVLKAGELATFILPRRFSIFIPALAEVESRYRKVGRYVSEVISEFIDYLQDNCYKGNDNIELRDEQLLRALQKKRSLLLYLYSAGLMFRDWDFDLKNERQYLADRYDKYTDDFTGDEEQVRKKYYLLLADEFVNR